MTYVQDDIRVSVIERTESLFRPGYDAERLDPPYLQAGRSASALPCRFRVSSVLVHFLLDLQRSSLARAYWAVGGWRHGRRTSEPKSSRFEPSISYFGGFVRCAIVLEACAETEWCILRCAQGQSRRST
jgi:hypothetical protein